MIAVDTRVKYDGAYRWATVRVFDAHGNVVEESERVDKHYTFDVPPTASRIITDDVIVAGTVAARAVALARAEKILAALTQEVTR